MPPTPTYACPLPLLGPPLRPSGPVNARLELQLGPTIPRRLLHRAPHRERFAGGSPLVWVEEPVTGRLEPWWAPRSSTRALGSVRPGEPLPGDLDVGVAAGLAAVGALGDDDAERVRSDRISAQLDTAARHFAGHGWTKVPSVLDAAPRLALAGYVAQLVERGARLGDEQCARRHGLHDERMARFVHHQLTGLVAAVTGVPIKPSYSYLAVYRTGATLPRHTDREQCEYTLSVLVDGPTGWPLLLTTPAGPIPCVGAPGDAVVFRGREMPHERGEFAGERSTHLLLHYVDVDFSGPLR